MALMQSWFMHSFKNIVNEKATITIIAPTVHGVILSDKSLLKAQEKIGGAPAVLFDAVAIFVNSAKDDLNKHPKVNEFILDAYNNYKYIAYVPESKDLITQHPFLSLDEGTICLKHKNDIKNFNKDEL